MTSIEVLKFHAFVVFLEFEILIACISLLLNLCFGSWPLSYYYYCFEV